MVKTQPCRHVVLFGKDGSFHIFLTYTAPTWPYLPKFEPGDLYREMVLMKNIRTFEKLPTNGFVHCTRLADLPHRTWMEHQNNTNLWWLSCYLAAAKEDRRSAILSTADTALPSQDIPSCHGLAGPMAFQLPFFLWEARCPLVI